MIRTLSILLLAAALSSPALAAGRKQPSAMPATPPTAQDMSADIGAASMPEAPMASPKPPPTMSPQLLMEGLSAIKGSPDGTQTEIGTPPRVKRMLMRQQGMIGTDDKNKKKTKKKDNKGDLQQIGDTAQYPYTTIGVIASGCSGTVVMKRFVLTAAWCVYDLKNKKFYPNLDFIPAMNGKTAPFGQVKWKNAWVAKGFVEKGDLNFGYGLIELSEDIGDKVGWFGFGHVPNFNFKSLALTGYPWQGVPPQTMWQSKCRIDAAEENAVFYRCPGSGDSLATMLGSPLWFKGKEDNAWQVVGIHVTSQNDQKNSWWASRLNAAATETLIAWAKSADQPDTQTDETDDQTDEVVDNGTDDDTADVEDEDADTDTEDVADNPNCTCEDQAAPK